MNQWEYDLQHSQDSPIYNEIDPEELEDMEQNEADNKNRSDRED